MWVERKEPVEQGQHRGRQPGAQEGSRRVKREGSRH